MTFKRPTAPFTLYVFVPYRAMPCTSTLLGGRQFRSRSSIVFKLFREDISTSTANLVLDAVHYVHRNCVVSIRTSHRSRHGNAARIEDTVAPTIRTRNDFHSPRNPLPEKATVILCKRGSGGDTEYKGWIAPARPTESDHGSFTSLKSLEMRYHRCKLSAIRTDIAQLFQNLLAV